MGKSTKRNFEVLDYQQRRAATLTVKQYLVYSYLISISKWDAERREDHYYIYKNQFQVKDVCAELNISQPTWRNALDKLEELHYIKRENEGKSIRINCITPFAPLDIKLIRYLVSCGVLISKTNKEAGGNIVSVYSLIYEYWRKSGGTCEININQIKQLYTTRRTAEDTLAYRGMLGYFMSSGLMDITFITRRKAGKEYVSYIIKNVSLEYNNALDEDNITEPEDINEILNILDTEKIDTITLTQDK